MKTTFDLPDPLLRQAKSVAAEQGRPLRDLVAEAIQEKLALHQSAGDEAKAKKPSDWDVYAAKLQKQPDGSYINPDGLDDDDPFYEILESIREERRGWQPRDPFADYESDELPAAQVESDETQNAQTPARAKR